MRKILDAISLGVLAVMFWTAWSSLYGPNRLPGRIPTHFDFAGHANRWGSPSVFMFVLPVVALALYLGMTVVERFPSAFNYPVRVTDENHPRLEALTLSMIGWLKAEVICLFACIQESSIEAARHGSGGLSPLLLPACLFVIFGTIAWHFVAMRRVSRTSSRS
jgi:uncharacterized membrane protein YjgN (DUF898 family)